MALIQARAVVSAFVVHLAGSGLTVHLSRSPAEPAPPCVTVHPDAGLYAGTLGDPGQDVRVGLQTTSIGSTPEQALWAHDRAAARLWRAVLAPAAGVVTLPIRQADGSPQPVRRDEQLAVPLFYVTCGWVVTAIPA